MSYGTRDHEDDLIEAEARERADEEAGLFWTDERTCPRHPHVKTSARSGQFDILCGECEAEGDAAAEVERLEADLYFRTAGGSARLDAADRAKALDAFRNDEADSDARFERRAALEEAGDSDDILF